MGTVMSYALGLDAGRPAPAGILALSGFVPTVDGWTPSLADRTSLRTFIAHGRNDQTIGCSSPAGPETCCRTAGWRWSTTRPTRATTSIRPTSRPPGSGSPAPSPPPS